MQPGPVDPDVLASARKHGIADLDAQHAYRNAVDAWVKDDLQMFVGPAMDGTLLEIGVVQASDQPGHLLIMHAMKARPSYIRKKR